MAFTRIIIIIKTYTAYRIAHDKRYSQASVIDQVSCRSSVTYILYVTAYVTVSTLALIAVVRYMGIVRSKASRFITRKTLVLSLCELWITMVAAKSPTIFAYHRMTAHDTGEYCDAASRRIVNHITFCKFAYSLPLAAIVLFSMDIWRHVRRCVMTSQL